MPSLPPIQPYWRRFGSFFLYPLSLEPLLACLGFGVLAGLAGAVFFPANLLLQLGVLVGTLRYGYKVLERTARGHLDDAQLLVHPGHGGKYLPYKQFVVIAIGLSLSAYAASIGGVHLAMVLLVFLGLLLPANTMLLALTNDLGESIAPPRLWALIHGIGMPYLGLCACLLLLSSSSAALLGWLVPVVPPMLVGALGGFLGAYFMVAMFRLMGYALYQYHDVLGLAVDVGFERQTASVARPDPAARRAAETAALIREGRFAEAIALARTELAENPGDQAANLRLHRLLCAVPGEERAMLAHAAEWLPALMRKGRERVAVDVIEAVWKHEPAYSLPLGAFILPLAQAFFDARRYAGAACLIKGFDRRFPGHADTPAVYLLGARLLIEHQRDETQARRVLAAIREHYPDSPAATEARRLGELLDRLATAANPSAAG
ncbi:hypothetical protein GPA27_06620 [Aromatoleum toluolicum]|uniref:Transmembrane protein n=1 Tax=Aromatoleum toluolicum TaxID=90060 RepID=A0ABX1NCP3_9RHOO|nr:hypothetical protein [Aromatoleum toluolicum]NMF97057.1 hypothetical protein [Aromatoleum toluolicum]